jgi:hypothetical protein
MSETETKQTVEAEVTPEVTEQAEPQTESTGAQPQAEPKLRLNYLGEEKEITLEEAKTLAQKGMNYDPLQQKWETSKQTLGKFEEIARKAGFLDANGHGDIAAYQEAANEQLRQREIEELTQGLELPKELAEELYLSRKEREERKALEQRALAEEAQRKQDLEFLDFYREVNGKDFDATTTLPKEVLTAMNNGTPLKHAYAEHLAKELIKEKAIEKANAENSNLSPGSVTGNGAGSEKEFFTSEELDRLSQKDLKNPAIFDKAMKSLKKIGG